MRALTALALSTTLIASSAFAAEVGPLAPGKPAGVAQAQLGTTVWALLGVGVLVTVVAVVASGSNGSPVPAIAPAANTFTATTTTG